MSSKTLDEKVRIIELERKARAFDWIAANGSVVAFGMPVRGFNQTLLEAVESVMSDDVPGYCAICANELQAVRPGKTQCPCCG